MIINFFSPEPNPRRLEAEMGPVDAVVGESAAILEYLIVEAQQQRVCRNSGPLLEEELEIFSNLVTVFV